MNIQSPVYCIIYLISVYIEFNSKLESIVVIHALMFHVFIVVFVMICLQECTDVARDDETLLVFSTLGGGLTAVDPITSEVRWSIDDGT